MPTKASCFMTLSNGNRLPIDIATTTSVEDYLLRQEQFRQKLAERNVQKAAEARRHAEDHAAKEKEATLKEKQAAFERNREEQCLCTQTHSLACPMTVYADKGALNRKVVITRATGRTPACSGCC